MSPQATFEHMLVDKLRPHPRNIRHEVLPSAELVASIQQDGILQPLVVAPHPTLEGDYTLIAGHHRLAAAKKAGLSQVPVVIRHDLAGDEQQIPAMVSENMHRRDLTVTEEADAYQAMLGFDGWDAKRIAKATGHNVARVRDRIKLGKLDESQRAALDDGQLTIERALVLAEFEDHPDLQEQLAGAASYNWDYQLQNAKKVADWRVKEPALRDVLTNTVGLEVVERPEEPSWRYDYPYETLHTEDPQEAKAKGAKVILDDDCWMSGGPVYVLPKGTQREETPEEAARREAQAERTARVEAMDAKLVTLVEVETEWIRTVVSGAARSERTMRVIGRHAAPQVLDSIIGYGGGYRERQHLAAHFGLNEDSETTIHEEAAKLPLLELVTLLTIVIMRAPNSRVTTCKPDVLAGDNQISQWFALRAELGWQETDVEREAKALAAELWPATPLEDDSEEAAA